MKKNLFFYMFFCFVLILVPLKVNANTNLTSIILNEGTVIIENNKTDYNVTIIGETFTVNGIKKAEEGALEEYFPSKSITLLPNETKSISIKITDHNDNKKIYTINAYRVDNKNSDNTLKELSISNTNIKFDGNSSYSATVENNINEIEIKATATNKNSKIEGLGKQELKVGQNTFYVNVTAQNGNKKEYKIIINKKEENKKQENKEENKQEIIPLSENNYLKILTINKINDFVFDKNVLDYNIIVPNTLEEIKLNYELEDTKSSATIVGNTKLSVGINKLILVVTAENKSVRKYNLNFTKEEDPQQEEEIDENTKKILDKLDKDDDTITIKINKNKENSDTNINQKIIDKLKLTKKTLIYEIINNSNNLIYSFSVNGKNITDKNTKLDYGLSFTTNNKNNISKLTNDLSPFYLNFTHSGVLPKDTKFKIYVGNRFKDNLVYLYYYNKSKNKLEYVDKSIKVEKGYVTLNIDHCSDYILLNEKINYLSKLIIMIVSVVLFTIIIFGLIFLIIKKIREKKRIDKLKSESDIGVSNPLVDNINENNKQEEVDEIIEVE